MISAFGEVSVGASTQETASNATMLDSAMKPPGRQGRQLE